MNILKTLEFSESSYSESDQLEMSAAGSSESNIRKHFKLDICKYVLADIIFAIYQLDLKSKIMLSWFSNNVWLFDCRCDPFDAVCCYKRQIKIALVNQIRKWLNKKEKLRYLHGGEECNCTQSYTLAEMEYHWEFIDHLANNRSPFEHMNTDARAFQQKFGNRLIYSPI